MCNTRDMTNQIITTVPGITSQAVTAPETDESSSQAGLASFRFRVF